MLLAVLLTKNYFLFFGKVIFLNFISACKIILGSLENISLIILNT